MTNVEREKAEKESWEYGAFRFLHDDGKYGGWIAYRSPNRETTEWAMNELIKQKDLPGFERMDLPIMEAQKVARYGAKVMFTFGRELERSGK